MIFYFIHIIKYLLLFINMENIIKSNIIASIPYIGEKYAERLLKEF